jgi:hypothetical protein
MHQGFWLVQDYLPEILEIDRRIFPSLNDIEGMIGPIDVHVVPVPADCSDGFLGAYWRRPSAYLNSRVRQAISTFSKVDSAPAIQRLQRDIEDGTWGDRYAPLQTLAELDIGYRMIVARYA